MNALAAWRGEFGDAYAKRNAGSGRHEALGDLWQDILGILHPSPRSILEVGAGDGANLKAIELATNATLHAVEPNSSARRALNEALPNVRIYDGTAEAIPLADNYIDLVLTSGVLIHILPEELAAACAGIHRVARRYIVSVEYFSDKPEEIEYRGHKGMLWKRDFGAFWMDNHPDLRLIDYGFVWRRATGLDNLMWFAFRK